MKKYLLILLGGVVLSACVSQRQYEDMERLKTEFEGKYNECASTLEASKADNASKQETIDDLNKDLKRLRVDSGEIASMYKMKSNLYTELEGKYQTLLTLNEKENKKMLANLKSMDAELSRKRKELEEQEENLGKLSANLEQTKASLKDREKRVKELQNILNTKDSAVTALKNTLNEALLGFKDNGLSVEIRNGKVYVSLEEQLLFASGSIVVDKKGRDALLKLAEVLQKQQEINILVEGHTDDVPMKSGQIKDNWDLSVLRATSIVRILTKDGNVDPKRFIAAGRGEYYPLVNEKTKEARKKNRRTEIILTPKLDELLKILDNH